MLRNDASPRSLFGKSLWVEPGFDGWYGFGGQVSCIYNLLSNCIAEENSIRFHNIHPFRTHVCGSVNGGQASNLCTYIAKGNVALSVLMTTATTIGAIAMTPTLCKGLLGAVVPVDAAGIAKSTVEVNFYEMFIICSLPEN